MAGQREITLYLLFMDFHHLKAGSAKGYGLQDLTQFKRSKNVQWQSL